MVLSRKFPLPGPLPGFGSQLLRRSWGEFCGSGPPKVKTERWLVRWFVLNYWPYIVIAASVVVIWILAREVRHLKAANDEAQQKVVTMLHREMRSDREIEKLQCELARSPDDIRQENNRLLAKLDEAEARNRRLEDDIRGIGFRRLLKALEGADRCLTRDLRQGPGPALGGRYGFFPEASGDPAFDARQAFFDARQIRFDAVHTGACRRRREAQGAV